jgi:type VI protein secretion system component VasF
MAAPDDEMARVRALLAEPEPPAAPVLDAARWLLAEVDRLRVSPRPAVPDPGTPELAAMVDDVAARMRQISARGGVHQWRPVIATVLDVLRDVSARRAGPDPAG